MAVLQYDFKIIGEAAVNKALAGIERRLALHNRRVTKTLSAGAPRARGRAARPELEAQRAARSQVQAVTQVERARIRSEQRVDRVARRIRTRRRRQAIRDVRAEERARVAAAKRERAARERFAGATAGRIGRGAVGSVAAVGRAGAGLLGISGGFLAAGAVRNQMRVQAGAASLANQAFREGQGPSREDIARSVERQARQLGATSGLGAEGVIRGMRESVAISGDLGITQQLAPLLADIADATDADVGDVGRTTGQIVQAFKARGLETEDVIRQTSDVLAAMAGQAKVGSIEFRDLAQQMGKLISSTATFEGEAGELATTMGAVAQLAIAGAASSPEEAMTAILRFADDLAKNARRFDRQGINVFTDDKKTKLRKPEEILFDVLKKTGGDLTKVGDLFGIRAKKAVAPFQTLFTEKGGGEAGMKAVQDLLDSIRGAKVTPKEIRESAAFRREKADKQFAIAIENLNAEIGKGLLPAITKLVPPLTKLVPFLSRAAEAFANFIDEFMKNPLAGLGKIIAAKVALDITRAAIGGVVRKTLTAAIQTSFGMTPAGGAAGAGGAGGAVVGAGGGRKAGRHRVGGAGMLGAQLGISVAALTITAGVVNFEAGEAKIKSAGQLLQQARESADPETARKAAKAAEEERASLEKPGILESFAAGVADLFLPKRGVLGMEETERQQTSREFGQDVAEFFGQRRPEQIKTLESFEREARSLELQREKLEAAAEKIRAAGLSQEEASRRIAQAAERLGVPLNRGNSPSPVKT